MSNEKQVIIRTDLKASEAQNLINETCNNYVYNEEYEINYDIILQDRLPGEKQLITVAIEISKYDDEEDY
jgi:hypothetical protein